ncbi:MAG: hypothetical protein LC623_09545 [Halobacteriales archaeon]|nr:hypothetical protein [Halobacteriales archaeon]
MPGGLLERIQATLDRFQTDMYPLPTWRQLASLHSTAINLDAAVDGAYRDAASLHYDATETNLQTTRWQLAGNVAAVAAAGVLAGAVLTWAWSMHWKRKMTLWIGYDAAFRVLDPVSLAGWGAAIVLALGIALAWPFGLSHLLHALLR